MKRRKTRGRKKLKVIWMNPFPYAKAYIHTILYARKLLYRQCCFYLDLVIVFVVVCYLSEMANIKEMKEEGKK